MTRILTKTILIGIVAGIVLFLLPMILFRIILPLVIILAIVRIFRRGRRRFFQHYQAGFMYKNETVSGNSRAEWLHANRQWYENPKQHNSVSRDIPIQ